MPPSTACVLAIALLAAPAFADDAARISFLESEIQKLRTQINEQDRRIQRLEAEIERLAGASAGARVTIGRPDTAPPAPAAAPLPWHSMAGWDAITQGMTREQVMEILGKPIAVETVDAYQTLFYRGATVKGTVISGHVNLRDGRVVEILPDLLQMKIASAEQSQQSHDDQVDCNDIVQKPGYDQNDDSGYKRNDRGEAESHIHGGLRASVVTM